MNAVQNFCRSSNVRKLNGNSTIQVAMLGPTGGGLTARVSAAAERTGIVRNGVKPISVTGLTSAPPDHGDLYTMR